MKTLKPELASLLDFLLLSCLHHTSHNAASIPLGHLRPRRLLGYDVQNCVDVMNGRGQNVELSGYPAGKESARMGMWLKKAMRSDAIKRARSMRNNWGSFTCVF